MSDPKTSISLTWDKTGRVTHKITGARLPSPRDDQDLWVLAPSGPLLLANQLGVMRPSSGLIACAHALDIASGQDFLLKPISSALSTAKVEFVYRRDGSLAVLFFPSYSALASSDSLEEGVRQLVSNYLYCVLDQFTAYYQLSIKTLACVIVGAYCDFLADAIAGGLIGPGRDRQTIEFSYWCRDVIRSVSPHYTVPGAGDDDWFAKQSEFVAGRVEDLRLQHISTSKGLGLA